MTNTFSWKGFTFMFDLQWVYGNKLINFTRQLMGNRVTFSNAYADIPVNAWTPENQNTMVPSLRLPGDGYENDVDSWSCEPGSFLRLRNIGLKYDFSSRMLSAAHIKSLSLGFNVENAFLITNYSGSDPEVTSYDAVFEQGGSLKEGFHRNTDARRHGAAQIIALGIYHAESGSSAHINNNKGAVIFRNSGYSIDNTVGTQFLWIVIQDIKTCLDTRTYHDGFRVEIALAHGFQNRNDWRNHGGDDNVFHVLKGKSTQLKQRTQN